MTANNAKSKSEKIHGFLDSDLNVKSQGEYQGKWNLDVDEQQFWRVTNISSEKFLHTDIVITDSFPISDIKEVQQLSETKNLSGIAKASVAGAVVGGPVGALAAGAFMAAKNNIFVEILLQDDSIIHGHLSQFAFEQMTMHLRTRDVQAEFVGIQSETGGEKFMTGCLVVFAIICLLALIAELGK